MEIRGNPILTLRLMETNFGAFFFLLETIIEIRWKSLFEKCSC